MGEGVQDEVAHPVDELGERGVAGQVHPHGEHVHEAADDAVQLGDLAAGHGRSHGDVLGARVPAEQRGERGQHDHVRRGPVRAAEPGQRGGHLGVEGERVSGARVGAFGRAWPVRRQVQRFQAGQPVAPVVQVALGRGQAALPGGVVGVPDLRGGRCAAVVAGEDLAQQHVGGPAVGGDVVDRDHQHVVVVAQPDQQRPCDGARPEVERRRQEPLGLFLGGGLVGRVADGEGERGVRGEHDARAAVLGGGEAHAQRVVPGHDGVERGGQGFGVERAAQPQPDRDRELGGARRELLQEPQPLLRVRQRRRLAAGACGDRAARGRPAPQPLCQQRLLGRRQLVRSRHRATFLSTIASEHLTPPPPAVPRPRRR